MFVGSVEVVWWWRTKAPCRDEKAKVVKVVKKLSLRVPDEEIPHFASFFLFFFPVVSWSGYPALLHRFQFSLFFIPFFFHLGYHDHLRPLR